MTILTIILTIILGVFLLSVGLKTKKNWLVVISIVLFLVALSQLLILFLMAFH